MIAYDSLPPASTSTVASMGSSVDGCGCHSDAADADDDRNVAMRATAQRKQTTTDVRRLPPSRQSRCHSFSHSGWCCYSLLLMATSLLVIAHHTAEAGGGSIKDMPDLSSIPTPPSFIHEPNVETLYFVLPTAIGKEKPAADRIQVLKARTFNCKAHAHPDVRYRWLKNGKEFDLNNERVTVMPGEGSFVFSELDESDEGVYQCVAENGNGTAVDQPINFKRTWNKAFDKSLHENVVEIELGDAFAHSCTAPFSVPKATVYWILMGAEQGQFNTINSSHISSNEEGTIFFHYVTEDDHKPNQYYTCVAQNEELDDYKFGNQFRISVTNNVRKTLTQVPPTQQFTNRDPHVIGIRGKETTLYCFYSGFPEPTPVWYKNGKLIGQKEVDRGLYELPYFGKALKLKSITDKHRGSYRCGFDTNNALDKEFTVDVQAAPYWAVNPPASVNSSEGSTVEFLCGAVGSPKPNFTFYKNGKAMKQLAGAHEIVGNRLILKDIRKDENGEGDNAVYQCKAQNEHGSVWANFYLNILSFKPVLLEGIGERRAVLGEDVTLTCRFFGSPMPTVTWHGSQLQGQHTKKFPKPDAEGVARIILEKISTSAAGEYSCHAQNTYGYYEGFGTLKVHEKTRLEYFPLSTNEVAGQPIRIPCTTIHDPALEVTVSWLIDGDPIPPELLTTRHYVLEADNTLVIPNPRKSDSAAYTCVADSDLDHINKTANIKIEDVPSPPYSVRTSKCEGAGRSAVVEFWHTESVNEPAPTTEYWIQYQIDRTTDGGAWRTYAFPVSAKSAKGKKDARMTTRNAEATISLDPYGTYHFRVIARNRIGDSSPMMSPDECVTAAAKPERNPTGVYAKGSTEDNMVIHWDPMSREEWNGKGFRYMVRYKPVDDQAVQPSGSEDDDGWTTVNVTDPYADQWVVKDTSPYQPFKVQVWAVNDEGPATVRPDTVMGRSGEKLPTYKVGDFKLLNKEGTTATFSWKGVDEADVEGGFEGIRIRHWYDENGGGGGGGRRRKRATRSEVKETVFSKDAKRGTVSDMKPFRMNYAQIMIYNSAGDGPPSDVVEVEMPEGVPTPVRELVGFPLNATAVGLKWELPREFNGILHGFVVSHCKIESSGGSRSVNTKDCPDQYVPIAQGAASQHLRIAELQPNSEYRFKVIGETNGGKGYPNSVDTKTLPTNVPGNVLPTLPVILDNPGIGEDHINVTWQPGPFDPNEPRPMGTDFYFKYREEGGDDKWLEARPVDGNFTVMLPNLKPGTTYRVVAVSVQKVKGEEPLKSESPVSRFTTKGEPVSEARIWWFLLLILLIILIILIILCLVCWLTRQRGAKYPVSEKEKQQGREPMLSKEERGFGEYTKPSDHEDEKKSLTGSKAESVGADSMAEYGDGETGRFTEDGSFIGQYVPNKVLVSTASSAEKSTGRNNVSTFV